MLAVAAVEAELADQSGDVLAFGVDAHINHRVAFVAFNEALGGNRPLHLMQHLQRLLLLFGGRDDAGQGLSASEFLALVHILQ